MYNSGSLYRDSTYPTGILPLVSPAMGHWGTRPLELQQFIFRYFTLELYQSRVKCLLDFMYHGYLS